MNDYKFGVTGKDRKALVTAISEILNTPSQYLKTPTYAFQVGNLNIDRNGTVSGEMTSDILTALAGRGFIPQQTEDAPDTTESQPEVEPETPAEPMADTEPGAVAAQITDTAPEAVNVIAEPKPEHTFTFNTPRGNFKIQAVYETAGEAESAGYGIYFTHNDHDVYTKFSGTGEHCKLFALVGASFATGETTPPEIPTELITENAPDAPTETDEPETTSGRVCIEVSLDGFTPESIAHLCKMVSAKEPLIKKALGADALPIRVLKDSIKFDWFNSADNITECTQFITLLCKTAKNKKRVTAKPQETFENEKFAMRVWLIGLGLIGKKYSQIRKLMTANLSGNGAYRYGQPDNVVRKTAAPAPENVTETSAGIAPDSAREAVPDTSPTDAAPNAEAANVAEAAAAERGMAYNKESA